MRVCLHGVKAECKKSGKNRKSKPSEHFAFVSSQLEFAYNESILSEALCVNAE